MVQDTNDGEFLVPPPQGGAVRPDPGPLAVGLFSYALSDQSIAVRQAADAAMQQVAEHGGLGRFMGLTETRGAYVAHPLGGCRMADSADLSEGADPAIDWPASVSDADPPRSSGSREACDLTEPLG
ncbi:MAG TPA: hypothetical protein VH231_19510 [Solirubrobacteraceae bacterium]|nr:hypothetical protein [Solirubrobacteraceae bacterium]